MNIDDPTPPDKLSCTVQTFVRPLHQFPPNFEARAKADGKGTISPAKNERMLLNTLLISIFKADPDVIIGHEFCDLASDSAKIRFFIDKTGTYATLWSRNIKHHAVPRPPNTITNMAITMGI
ncbi:hypothetical protein F5887DRAFT_437115 [Amanita rubescens]|nr:hypothetical protein F5887DRAFT_437115 [Amanita rubescens]